MKPTDYNVNCTFGAPMGRETVLAAFYEQSEPVKASLYRVAIDRGGYDKGGAYWGIGKPLYCAHADGFQAFQRANTRQEAMDALKQQYRTYGTLKFKGDKNTLQTKGKVG
jgi:hypothetical protein